MKILFIHQNFPGQYRYLARHLGQEAANRVVFITKPSEGGIPGVEKVEYTPGRDPAPSTHPYVVGFERAVLHAQAVARAALVLKKEGFTPDIVCAHPGWGEAMYIKDVFPEAPLVNYCEWYYRAVGADIDFDPAAPVDLDRRCRTRTRNALHLLNLEACDHGIAPTRWQQRQFPAEFRQKISVIHEGIDTSTVRPDADARFTLPDGRELGRKHEVVTYVARNLEPYRGFPSFMRALPRICERRPNAHVVIAGGDEISYSKRLPDGLTYRQQLLEEVRIDPQRVHFLGKIPYSRFVKLLQVSSAHVYLTVPFLLSWSMLEAMAAGCVVVASNTPPVVEVVENGKNGFLVDFFSPDEIAERVSEVLARREQLGGISEAARRTIVHRYELTKCLPRHLELIRGLARGAGLRHVPPHGPSSHSSRKARAKLSRIGAKR